MKTLQTIFLSLLLSTLLSACSGSGGCYKGEDVADCRIKAEQGVANAQYDLGVRLDNGLGVVQDYNEAVKWYRLAAEQGVAPAQFNLGKMYYRGKGVAQDY